MNTKEKIEVMQAYADGKTVQSNLHDNKWRDVPPGREPTWCWATYQYRIKKEPLVFYVNVEEGKFTGHLWENIEDARRLRGLGARTIKLVEEL